MKKEITIGEFDAYHSHPDDGQKHPGLVLIHEIWGLVDHIKDVADRFAAEGYSVIAPNLFHGLPFEGKVDHTILAEMHDPEKKDEAQKKMREVMAPIQAPEFASKALAELKQCVDYLEADEHVTGRIAVLGFCFGGTYALHLAAHDGRIKAAVPFYGHPAEASEVMSITCPVLAFYGNEDERLMQSLPRFKADMEAAGKEFETVVYTNAGHAFFNDQNERMYRADAAKDSWEKALAFLKRNLNV